MQIEKALEEMSLQAKAQGADQFDIVAGASSSDGINVFAKKVQSVELSSSQGIGIRLFRNGKPGYAFTERFSTEAIAQTVKDAISHTDLTAELPLEVSDIHSKECDFGNWNESIGELATDSMKSYCLELEEAVLASTPEITNVPYLGFSRSSGSSLFLNSKGQAFENKANSYSFGAGATAERGNAKKMGIYSVSGRDLGLVDVSFISNKVKERSLELLGASPISSGEYPVLLSNRISSQMVSMFSAAFFAENVHKGQSRLEGKCGEKIGVTDLQIINDPTLFGMPGSECFDGEGVVASKFSVIENGFLQNYLYNLESAQKDNVLSNGCAARGYSGKVGTSFSNLIIPKGSSSLTDLQKKQERCLYVVKLEGGSGCSSVSGEISIGAQGFLIENGIVVQAVDGITISGNFFDLLQSIEGISDQYSEQYSSYKVPDLLVSGLNISG